MINRSTSTSQLSPQTSSPQYLAQDIGVGVVLQQHGCRSGVVVAGGDVQCRKAHLALGAIADEQRHYILVPLLQRHRQWGEAVLPIGQPGAMETMGDRAQSLKPKQPGTLMSTTVIALD